MRLGYWLRDPANIVVGLARRGLLNWINDEAYLKFLFRLKTGLNLNLAFPKTFNEKLQWLKLYNRNPLYTSLVDKYCVRAYVEKTIGSEYLIPLIGVYTKFDDIDFDELPSQFVIKCNHDSGGVFICKDKHNLKNKKYKSKVRAFFAKKMRCNYYWPGREWPYLNVERKLIIEQYLEDGNNHELRDYKFFCFMGEPRIIQVDYNRFSGHLRKMFDLDWNCLPFTTGYPTDAEHEIDKPITLQKMISIAKQLARECIPFVRVDLYSIGEQVFFGEMTFYHGGGMERFSQEDWDYKLGDLIDLSKIK